MNYEKLYIDSLFSLIFFVSFLSPKVMRIITPVLKFI